MENMQHFQSSLPFQDVNGRIFYLSTDKYLFEKADSKSLTEVDSIAKTNKKKTVVYLPIVADTEFQTMSDKYRPLLESLNLGSLTLTAQLKTVHSSISHIFSHWDLNKTELPIHFPILQSECAAFDYVNTFGYSTTLMRCEGKLGQTWYNAVGKKRVLRLVIFAHFAVADFFRLFNGQLKKDLVKLCYQSVGNSRINQKRRLTTEYTYGKGQFKKEYVKPQWVITLGDFDYALEISVVDSGAVHGPVSLSDLGRNTGVSLEYKDEMSKSDKADMLSQYLEHTSKFRNYALGDLAVYDALSNNAHLFKHIYEVLGVNAYYKIPALTIGATVSNLFRAVVAKYFESVYCEILDDKTLDELINFACIPASANQLIKRENTTGGLNAKVLGGRCFNNRPLDTVDIGVIVDTDISGCYGEGMRNQLYPFGKPIIIEYPKDSTKNDYLCLRNFLNRYQNELVPGLWQVWFSVTKDTNPVNPQSLELPTPQDFFSSYHPPKRWGEMKSDTDNKEESWLELPDESKIYSHQITNGLLTHDSLQWLENVCSRPLKNFILDKAHFAGVAGSYDEKM